METTMNTQHSNFNSRARIKNRVKLELLALDLDTCTRCVGTLDNIETAINKVSSILKLTSTKIEVHKILIESKMEAEAHQFVSSPTIRINGLDIVFDTLESECDSCTDLCGCEEGTNCRVWNYRGQEYTEAPVGLIVESMMTEIYGGRYEAVQEAQTFQKVPQNLKQFFASKEKNEAGEASTCCSTEKQETCCEPAEKETCCQAEESETCGCQ